MRLALIGAKGMLAQAVIKAAPPTYTVIGFDLPELDITNREQVLSVLAEARPEVIINCAAFTNVDACETQEDLATRVNGEGPGHLAAAARQTGATLVHISTDYVFAGTGARPHTEEDPVAPQSAYGRSKLRGEEALLGSGLERLFIVRTSWLYGAGGKNFVDTIARLAGEREELRVVADQVGSPTYTGDLADGIFRLIALADHGSRITDHDIYGLYHFANEGACSWHQFAEAVVDELRRTGAPVKAQRVLPIGTEEYPLPARRPAYSVLSKEKYKAATGAEIPHWRESLGKYIDCRF